MFLTALFAGALSPTVPPMDPDLALWESPIVFGPRPQEDDEAPKWTRALNVGATFTSGNSDTLTLASTFDAERKTDEDRWTADLYWYFGEQEDAAGDTDVTQREYGGKVQYDRFVGEKLYYYGNLSGDKDDVANLQLRAILGAGGGYQFRDDEHFTLNGEAGLSGVHEDNVGDGPDEYLSARLAYNAGYQFSESTRFEQSTQLLPSLKDSRDFYAKMETTMSVSMTEALSLRVQHILEYDNSPAGGTGDGIRKADNKLILSLSWTF